MSDNNLFTTFYVGPDLFGIEVLKVQEVTGALRVAPVPLAPPFIKGLINLRGQLATALGLKQLFGQTVQAQADEMSVICKMDGNLVSIIVDQIGDVIETEPSQLEQTPETLPSGVKKYVKGIYKMNGTLLSVLDLDKISKELSPGLEKQDSTN